MEKLVYTAVVFSGVLGGGGERKDRQRDIIYIKKILEKA